MQMTRRRLLHLAAAAAVLGARSAGAQACPARPVRVIVPFAPAGPTDVFARLMAQKLSEQLGTQFYVENIAGAGGNIGAGRAAQAPADGYTILVNGGNHVVNPALYQHVSYDPIKDFDPVTIAVSAPAVLTVHPSLPAPTVQDLVALIRANPGKYSFASPGTGTPPHLVGELFRNAKLRALAVSSKRRSPALPDVPTMTEAGYPEVVGESWFAAVVPAGTPREIVVQLNREIARAIAQPDMQERLAALGYEPVASTPEDAAARFQAEMAKWGKVISHAGIKAQ
jgi:tripartite-type tricarboxylate transporter receptor subunit TctC